MLVFLQVHILADVTSLSVTPSSAGLNVLDEHCMPDRDRIPHASIHYLFTIFKSFVRQFMIYAHFYAFFMCIVHMKQPFHMGRSYVGSNQGCSLPLPGRLQGSPLSPRRIAFPQGDRNGPHPAPHLPRPYNDPWQVAILSSSL